VFPATSADKPDQAPICFTSVGEGYLGFVGSVNTEEESTSVILALCNLA
jgi:hypothetical protein